MSKRNRRLLFYLLLLIFVLAGAITIFYAEGLRFNFEKFGLESVGALYVKTYPAESVIFLNNRQITSRPGLFQSGTLIGDLLPTTYQLKVQAPGYQTFKKTVSISPSMVAKIENLTLVPTQLIPLSATSSIKDFWPINQDFLIQKNSGSLVWNNKKIGGNEVVGWSNDFNNLLTYDSKSKNYFLTNLPNYYSVNLTSFVENYLPKADRRFKLFAVNRYPNQLFLKSGIYWGLLDFQNFQISDLGLLTTTTLKSDVIKLDSPNGNQIYILKADGDLLSADLSNETISEVATGTKDFAISPDYSMLALLQDKDVKIISLTADKPLLAFLISDIKDAQKLSWYKDNEHLFVAYQNKINFLSLDDQNLESYQAVVQSAKSVYDPNSNRLYFLKDGEIYYFEFPE